MRRYRFISVSVLLLMAALLYLAGDTVTGVVLHSTGPRVLVAGEEDAYQSIYYAEEDFVDDAFKQLLQADFALTLNMPGTKPRTYTGAQLLVTGPIDGHLQAELYMDARNAYLKLIITTTP